MIKKINDENFEETINSIKSLFYIKFGSKTCGPCNTMKPVLEKFSELNPEYPILEIDTEESPLTSTLFEIRSVPTIHLCKEREVLYSFSGITPLSDLTYAIKNTQDPYFLEHGEFKASGSSSNGLFNLIIVSLLLIFVITILYLN